MDEFNETESQRTLNHVGSRRSYGIANWRRYSFGQFIAITLLALSLIRFASVIYSTTVEKDAIVAGVQTSNASAGALRQYWSNAVWYWWDRTPESERVAGRASEVIHSRRRWSIAFVVFAWLLTWVAFRERGEAP